MANRDYKLRVFDQNTPDYDATIYEKNTPDYDSNFIISVR